MRFIIGFIFFGLLFYGIWIYYPETFQVLVSWAAKTFDFVKDLFSQLTDKVSSSHTSAPANPTPK